MLGEKNSLNKDIDLQSIQNVGNGHIMYNYNGERNDGSEVMGVFMVVIQLTQQVDLNSIDYKNNFSI